MEPNILRYLFELSGPCPDFDTIVYHGTWWYGLRNIIEHRMLLESCDQDLGHDFTDPGVYTSPHMATAKQYARPQVVFNDGHTHRVILECAVLTGQRLKRRRKGGDQWIYAAADVHLKAVLVLCNDFPVVGWGEECLLCWMDFLEAQSHRPPLVAGFEEAWQGHAQHAEGQASQGHAQHAEGQARQGHAQRAEEQPGQPSQQKPPSSTEDQPGKPSEGQEQRQNEGQEQRQPPPSSSGKRQPPPSSSEDQPGEPQEQKPLSTEDQPGKPSEGQEQRQNEGQEQRQPPPGKPSEGQEQRQNEGQEQRQPPPSSSPPPSSDSEEEEPRAMPSGADRAMPGGRLLLQPCFAYQKVEAAVPWVHAFVEMHAAVYFCEREWRQPTLDFFSAPPAWLECHFDRVSGYEAPFTWANICSSLLHAHEWVVDIGNTQRNMNTLMGMVNSMLAKGVRAVAGNMHPLAGLCFVELLCDLFNGCAARAGIDARMLVKTQPDPEAPAEIPVAKRKMVPTAAVRIETQHGMASAKYRRLTTEQRRTNILRGRVARSQPSTTR